MLDELQRLDTMLWQTTACSEEMSLQVELTFAPQPNPEDNLQWTQKY